MKFRPSGLLGLQVANGNHPNFFNVFDQRDTTFDRLIVREILWDRIGARNAGRVQDVLPTCLLICYWVATSFDHDRCHRNLSWFVWLSRFVARISVAFPSLYFAKLYTSELEALMRE